MYTPEVLLDILERSHRSLAGLIAHCEQFSPDELAREHVGFGYGSIRLQLHHEIGAQKYWIGVLEGRMDVDDNDADFPTAARLEAFRQEVYQLTESYLRSVSNEDLNRPQAVVTWGGHERELVPALVVLRPLMHLYQHAGQIAAMCRLLGKPIPPGLDFPLTAPGE